MTALKSSVGHLINNVRPTALALTVFAQFADPISSQVIKLINRPNFMILMAELADPMGYALQQYHENPELAFKVLQLVKKTGFKYPGSESYSRAIYRSSS